ncbi:hypothetical protein TKK_0016381 [Trichogramma kaykai]|uniref:CCHC-type domain-containing protein n=1 Tax=Trichogramma kaykai TaxID=54128 RepID=A0ABD2W673_9HYME
MRFARAKGSKASNERVPENATPWHEMKAQLEEVKKKSKEPATTKTKTARQLLKEKDDPNCPASNSGGDWAEFDVPKKNKKLIEDGSVGKKEKIDKKKLKKGAKKHVGAANGMKKPVEATNDVKKPVEAANNMSKHVEATKSTKKHVETVSDTKKHLEAVSDVSKSVEARNENKEDGQQLSKRQKRNKKKQIAKNAVNENNESSMFDNEWGLKVTDNKGPSLEDYANAPDSNTAPQVIESQSQTTENAADAKPKKFKRKFGCLDDKNFWRFGSLDNVPKKFQKKVAKPRDNGEHKRRKPDFHSTKVTINGVDVEICKYDGFPVKKEDAIRLTELRKEMVMKGIPKRDIDAAMKLERRKAEKVLARIRRQVCFHCRKAGHNLSDCPELNHEEGATGICFKCGSTEHTHFECKVNKKEGEYSFAKCFICSERGHIAKQCPQNSRGLYPDGGSCNICGDVTHLKKDCPTLIKKKEETTLTLDRLTNDNLESLEGEGMVVEKVEEKPRKKVIKF